MYLNFFERYRIGKNSFFLLRFVISGLVKIGNEVMLDKFFIRLPLVVGIIAI